MNYEEIESLLTEADAENEKGNYSEVERLCNLVLEKIPHIRALEVGKSKAKPQSQSGEDFNKIVLMRTRALNELSEAFHRRGMAKETLSTAEEALFLSIQEQNKEQESKALSALGVAYRLLSDYPKAIEYLTKSLAINEEIGNKSGVASNTGNIGIVYFCLPNYFKALEYFLKALAINEEIGNKLEASKNTLNIGNVYHGLSDFPRALEYFTKNLSFFEEIGNKHGVAITNGNIGNVYQSLCDCPRALEYMTKSLLIYEEIEDKSGIAHITGNMGIQFFWVQNYSKAFEYCSKALAINEEIENKSGVAANIGIIGTIYGTLEFEGYDTKKAEDHLLKAQAIYEEIGAKNFESHKALGEFYENEKRWEEALMYFKKYHEIEKEVVSETAKKKAELFEQQKQVAEREKEIEIAKAAADAKLNATASLLNRVLPESISTRMINGEENISDYFPSISILFADIQGFTAISANMKAIDVVRFLNFVFGEFDRIMKVHGCEKIKTIGDGYMAVAGAPIECEDHAERLAAAALEMQETIHLPEDIRQTMPEGSRFGIRIGLHTGSVVAGVIGEERFVYDIHSDAVNLASRMESSGEVDRVHVSSDFAEHLQARFQQTKNTKHGILLEDRGESNIKGKGMMRTYFLEKES